MDSNFVINSPSFILYRLVCYSNTQTVMDDDTSEQAFAELKTRNIGGWGVAQIGLGTGLAVYAMWVGILQPGFRKVPLKLQVCWSNCQTRILRVD